MSLVVAEEIQFFYDDLEVLRKVSFRVEPGDRIGLIGPNGEGKTTLLRTLGRLAAPTAGKVQHKKGLRVGYLPQEPPVLGEQPLWESALEVFEPVRRLEAELAVLAERMARPDCDPQVVHRFSDLQHELEARGGYDYETRIKAVLTGLGFSPDQHHVPMGHLSGGQRTRALLARLLLEEPELLLLDEPTNHLDMQAVEWLERWLESFNGSIVAVAHDRYFLDRVTNRTWEVAFGELEVYRGNYTAHLKQKEDRFKERMRLWEAQQAYVAKTEEYVRRFHYAQRSAQAHGRQTRLERFLEQEAIDRPKEHRQIHLRLEPATRTGDLVVQSDGMAIGYVPGKPLARIPELRVDRRDRVALVGPNGTGKTTLMRTILGELRPLEGRVRLGAGVQVGYLAQSHANLDPEATVIDSLVAYQTKTTLENARTILGSLLITGEDVYKKIGQLSGGQKSRVLLARLAIQDANVLMLDEPTNHLDIPSQEVLQEALQEFEGTVIFVSHDRYLVQALATHVWAFEGGDFHVIRGGWEEYLKWRAARAEAAAAESERSARKEAYRQSLREQRQIERQRARHGRLEAEIEEAEKRLSALHDEITEAGQRQDVQRVEELGLAYQATQERLDGLWTEYTEVVDGMEE